MASLILVAMAVTASVVLIEPAAAESPSDVAADFNNDGFADLAVGAPGENDIAGVVYVLYGTSGGLSSSGAQVFGQVGGPSGFLDRFGSALAAGDFNNDGFADLAAGASGRVVAGNPNAGAVSVFYGSTDGLTRSGARLFTQPASDIRTDEQFGFALAAGDFDNDGFADLAAGAPREAVGNDFWTGAVSVLPGSPGGLTATGAQFFTQVGGAVEDNDEFGSALAAGDFNNDDFADLAAGAPGEAVGNLGGAGAVSVLPGSADGLTATGGRLFTQVGGAVEGGDLFGQALATGDFNNNGFVDLAAGAPTENVGAATNAGAVSVLNGSAGGLTATGGRLFTQSGSGRVETLDLFGWSLAADDVDNNGFADLAAGAPFEDVGAVNSAGAVSVLPGSAGGLTTSGAQLFTQSGTGRVEADDQFGSQLAAGDFNDNGSADLAVAAPTEDIGTVNAAGAVSVLQGSGGGLTTTGGQLWTQNTAGVPGIAETFDLFGGLEIFL